MRNILLLSVISTVGLADRNVPMKPQAYASIIPTVGMYYTAYKLDFFARGATGALAQACITRDGKMCNFGEYMGKTVDPRNLNGDPKGSGGNWKIFNPKHPELQTFDPTWETLNKAKTQAHFEGMMDTQKVLKNPGRADNGVAFTKNFVDEVQLSRQALEGKKGKETVENLVKANAWAVETRVWMNEVHGARKMENINAIMGDFERYYMMDESNSKKNPVPGKPQDGYFSIEWREKPAGSTTIGKYQVPDIDIMRTMQDTKARFTHVNQHTFIKDMDKTWNSWLDPPEGTVLSPGRKNSINHLNVIHQYVAGEQRLQGPPTC